jgi:nitroimidazol reductase NimA-like FMN-containing flavoprotein (pyridoxamine 5'-phosphate oxidase superfamily)
VVGRIGCHADGQTYLVPVIYAYDGRSFVVASIDGRKIRMMRTEPSVCFEVDEYAKTGWRSAIAQGRYVELTEVRDVEDALRLLRDRFGSAPRGGGKAPGDTTVVFRIEIEEVTGRAVRR